MTTVYYLAEDKRNPVLPPLESGLSCIEELKTSRNVYNEVVNYLTTRLALSKDNMLLNKKKMNMHNKMSIGNFSKDNQHSNSVLENT